MEAQERKGCFRIDSLLWEQTELLTGWLCVREGKVEMIALIA